MPVGLKGNDNRVSAQVGEDVRAALTDMTQKRSAASGKPVYVSDILREAIEEYLQKHGYDLSIDVNRGGWRGGEKS